MAWQDRIRPASYTSPSGARFTFDFENVSREVNKKTSTYDFPDAEGTYVQDLGKTGKRYPLRIIFWGDNYDEIATEFEDAVSETGIGLLEHPMYGPVDVIAVDSIVRRDDLKTAANQAIIQITFWETIRLIYPISQIDGVSSISSTIDSYNIASADTLNNNLDISDQAKQVNIRNKYNSLLSPATNTLRQIADNTTAVQQQFNAIERSINQGIDTLVGKPLTLAFQTNILLQAPARAVSAIGARFEAYSNLAQSITSTSESGNNFYISDLFASSYVSAMAVTIINTEFETKTQAIESAETIIDTFEAVQSWREDNLESPDTGEAYQQLQELLALSVGYLVDISFRLKQERRLILDRSRTIIDLVAEIFGVVDEALDRFIIDNDLSGSEILEIPRGKEIVYFI
jgi:prophage DNA circulation protein